MKYRVITAAAVLTAAARLYRRADLGVLWACAGGKMDGKAAFPAG